ncbi:MAG: phosphatase PAP2 family protein [Ignavibacteriales bacterium]|nr:phosphatase PAP2 family protein [Ignavibacteriales bacterium]
MCVFFLCIVFSISSNQIVYTQTNIFSHSSFFLPPSSLLNSRFDNSSSYFNSYFSHYKQGITESFFTTDAATWLGVGGITIAGMSLFDTKSKTYFPKQNFLSTSVSSFAYNFGGGPKTYITILGTLGGIAVHSSLTNESNEIYFSKAELVLETVATTSLITQILKHTISRSRPNNSDTKSFPSGHTSLSFSLATPLYEIYGWKVGVPAFALASVVGVQRMQTNAHHLSDVLSGALLGIMVGKGFGKVHQEENEEAISFAPNVLMLNNTFIPAIKTSFRLK